MSKECLERNKKPIFDLVKKWAYFNFEIFLWINLNLFLFFRFKALAKGVYPIDDYNNLPNLYDNDNKKQVKRLSKKSKKSKKDKISNKIKN